MSSLWLRRAGALVALVLALSLGAARAQDEDEDAGDDENPSHLSREELDQLKKFQELEQFAIDALRKKDFEGAARRYRKLVRKLDEAEGINAPSLRRLKTYAHYNLACTLSLDGQTDDAIAEFRLSVELGFWDWKHVRKDADLDPIRTEEAFKKAVRHGKKIEEEAYEEAETAFLEQARASLASGKAIGDYDFKVTSLAGEELSLADYKGKPLVVVFILTWGGGEDPVLETLVKLAPRLKKKDVELLGIVPAHKAAGTDSITQYLTAHEVKFQVATARPSAPALEPFYKAFGDLKLLAIGKDGKLRARAVRLRSEETLEAVADLLLEQEVPPEPKKPEKPAPEKPAPEKR